MSTLIAVVILIILSTLSVDKFEEWYAMTEMVNRLPYITFLFGLIFFIGTFVLEATYVFGIQLGVAQILIFNICAAILFGAITHLVYCLEVVESESYNRLSESSLLAEEVVEEGSD